MGLAVEDEHVAGGEVAVDDAGGVQRRQRVGEAAREPVEVFQWQRPGAGHEVVEARPGDEARDEVGQVRLDVGVEHLDEVRPADAPQRLELVPEAPTRVGVGEAVAQDLHRDRALVGGDAEVDGAHAALAETTEQAVRADAGRVGRSQRCDGHRDSSALDGCRLRG